MSKFSLFFGAALMIIMGLVVHDKTQINCGLVLMWIGCSVKGDY